MSSLLAQHHHHHPATFTGPQNIPNTNTTNNNDNAVTSSSSTAEKPKHRKRTRATAEQLAVLENTFAVTVSPNAKLRKQLSERLKMSERSIQIWFQNRRAKVKHMQKRAQQQQQQQRANMFWRAQSVDSTLFHQPFALTHPAIPTTTSDMMMVNQHHPSSTMMRPMSMPPPAIQPTTTTNMMLPPPQQQPSSPTTAALMENLYILSATTLTIGTWQRLALNVTDLMLTFAQDVFAWHIYDNGLQFKIHIPLSTVAGITQDGEQVHLDLTEPPLFYMMTTEQDGKQPQRWVQCSDFSEGQQASQCLRHTLKGASEQLKQDLFALFYAIGHLVRFNTTGSNIVQQQDDSSDSSISTISSNSSSNNNNTYHPNDPYACMYPPPSLLPTTTTTAAENGDGTLSIVDDWTLQQMLPVSCSNTTTTTTTAAATPFFIAQE
ncbi:hypothetical protein O0I10_003807 [Lichtheimia ornata]|uniref:Homeobox domain-containing protein n=1 Tax=Lichtheimia ornata TaxID=688661 RepID=A0AAD7XZN1_9FUNG|nr:uncharacterized protein O0I10_003807 [Lichtheimia ornata]KAJ8660350.1 hypothetical protein O0I10_003807 [Lichtheimia ornata]